MQTVSYNDLTKRAQGRVLSATKSGLDVCVKPARRGWEVFYDSLDRPCPSDSYPVVDIPVNGVAQETVILSQDAQNWIKAMKKTLPVLTESEIVCAALQHYALYLLGFAAANPEAFLEEGESPYAPEVIEQWQNEFETEAQNE